MKIDVLISHAHDERSLAMAWKNLLQSISIGAIRAWFSSDQSAEGGMPVGKKWRDELNERLETCHCVLAIQTPATAGRAWIMWECGVASGRYGKKEKLIIPVLFGMKTNELSNPLSAYQVYRGDDKDNVRQLCERLVKLEPLELSFRPEMFEMDYASYLSAIELHKPRKPVEAEQLRLWRSRFEELIRAGGTAAQLLDKRDAMYASLGANFKASEPSLHELLSRALVDLGTKKDPRPWRASIEESDRALALLGEDLDLLHRKALCLTELEKLEEAEALVGVIVGKHPEVANNAEFASLEGRIHRERWRKSGEKAQLELARDAYRRAYNANPAQYYPGINAGSLSLALGDVQGARIIFQDVLQTCAKLTERPAVSFWVDFSEGEAHLGMGRGDLALDAYGRGLKRDPAPLPRQKTSALQGVQRMIEFLQRAGQPVPVEIANIVGLFGDG